MMETQAAFARCSPCLVGLRYGISSFENSFSPRSRFKNVHTDTPSQWCLLIVGWLVCGQGLLALCSLDLKALTWNEKAQGGETLPTAGLKIKEILYAVEKGFLLISLRLWALRP